MKCNPRYAIAVAVGFLAIATPNDVLASPLDWFKFGPTEAVDVVTISYGSFNNLSVYAGQYVGTLATTEPGLSAPSAQKFNTFCVDLNDEVSVNQEYEVAPTSTNTSPGRRNRLMKSCSDSSKPAPWRNSRHNQLSASSLNRVFPISSRKS